MTIEARLRPIILSRLEESHDAVNDFALNARVPKNSSLRDQKTLWKCRFPLFEMHPFEHLTSNDPTKYSAKYSFWSRGFFSLDSYPEQFVSTTPALCMEIAASYQMRFTQGSLELPVHGLLKFRHEVLLIERAGNAEDTYRRIGIGHILVEVQWSHEHNRSTLLSTKLDEIQDVKKDFFDDIHPCLITLL